VLITREVTKENIKYSKDSETITVLEKKHEEERLTAKGGEEKELNTNDLINFKVKSEIEEEQKEEDWIAKEEWRCGSDNNYPVQ
jgi:hypothetical protein